jgi:excisionase family DNA binding protein
MAGRPAREANPRHARRRAVYPASDAAILTITEVAELLRVSRSTIERFVHRNGMPFIDLGSHNPKRRSRRLLRFERDAVLVWARARSAVGNPQQ